MNDTKKVNEGFTTEPVKLLRNFSANLEAVVLEDRKIVVFVVVALIRSVDLTIVILL